MMKTTDAARSIYRRNGITHVCFSGKYYAPASKDSTIDVELPVTCQKLESDGGRARIEVTQRRPGRATLTEVWRSVTIPRGTRGKKQ